MCQDKGNGFRIRRNARDVFAAWKDELRLPMLCDNDAVEVHVNYCCKKDGRRFDQYFREEENRKPISCRFFLSLLLYYSFFLIIIITYIIYIYFFVYEYIYFFHSRY